MPAAATLVKFEMVNWLNSTNSPRNLARWKCEITFHHFTEAVCLVKFLKMSQLKGIDFDLFENTVYSTNNKADLFNVVTDIEVVSLEFLTDFAIYSDTEKDVVKRHEVSVIFDKFSDLQTSSSTHKMILSNLFTIVCAFACDR